MEKFESYKSKYTPEQIKRFDKIIEQCGLIDESPDEFIFHFKKEDGSENIIHLAKKEKIDLVVGKNKKGQDKIIEIDIEDAARAVKNNPENPMSESLKSLNITAENENGAKILKYPGLYE